MSAGGTGAAYRLRPEGAMGHETELKFVGPRDAVARLRGSPALLAYSKVEHARTRALKATYFDTEDLSLRKAGYVLRVRDEGGRFVQTVKTVNGASVATRTEIKSLVRKQRRFCGAGSSRRSSRSRHGARQCA
jgi:hypothetical protein